MAQTFQCDIVTPEKNVFTGEVDFIALSAGEGELGVLSHCAPTVTTLRPGELRIKRDGSAEPTDRFAVSGGYAQIDNNGVIVLASNVANVAEIDAGEVAKRIEELEGKKAALKEGEAGGDYIDSELAWERLKQSLVTKQ
jgi:F-type H+-transporting ATPase subunit epsilon